MGDSGGRAHQFRGPGGSEGCNGISGGRPDGIHSHTGRADIIHGHLPDAVRKGIARGNGVDLGIGKDPGRMEVKRSILGIALKGNYPAGVHPLWVWAGNIGPNQPLFLRSPRRFCDGPFDQRAIHPDLIGGVGKGNALAFCSDTEQECH